MAVSSGTAISWWTRRGRRRSAVREDLAVTAGPVPAAPGPGAEAPGFFRRMTTRHVRSAGFRQARRRSGVEVEGLLGGRRRLVLLHDGTKPLPIDEGPELLREVAELGEVVGGVLVGCSRIPGGGEPGVLVDLDPGPRARDVVGELIAGLVGA